MRDLTITLFQTDLAWEDIDTNIAAFDKKISRLSGQRDFIKRLENPAVHLL